MAENLIDIGIDIPQEEPWGIAPPFVPPHRHENTDSASDFRNELERLSSSVDPILEKGTLGGYQLRQKIGSGRMGTVYSAYDPLNDRTVAIKVLHRDLMSK
ncbi:MAG: hypothetical protein WKF77_26630 [Planctomycetaceae bacterium]